MAFSSQRNLDFATREDVDDLRRELCAIIERKVNDLTSHVEEFFRERLQAAMQSCLEEMTKSDSDSLEEPETTTLSSGLEKKKDRCFVCQERHISLGNCRVFKNLSVQDRLKFVRQNRVCFKCLCQGHRMINCPAEKFKCGVGGCKKNHHSMLHSNAAVKFDDDDYQLFAFWTHNDEDTPSSGLPILPCMASNGHKSVKVCALLKSGANFTCVTEALAIELDLPTYGAKTKKLHDPTGTAHQSRRVLLSLQSCDGSVSKVVIAWTLPSLGGAKHIIDWEKEKKNFPSLRKYTFESLPDNPKLDVIIGSDYPELVLFELGEGRAGGPVLAKALLGLTAIGRPKRGH